MQAGRARFVAQFPSVATPDVQRRLPPPHELATFERCRLRWAEYEEHGVHRRLHEDLIAMRRNDAAFSGQLPGALDGAVLDAEAFVLQVCSDGSADERLVLINLGSDLVAGSLAEPLVAPPSGHSWSVRWSSEHPDYGGVGTPEVTGEAGWRIPAHSAVVLRPRESTDERDGTHSG